MQLYKDFTDKTMVLHNQPPELRSQKTGLKAYQHL